MLEAIAIKTLRASMRTSASNTARATRHLPKCLFGSERVLQEGGVAHTCHFHQGGRIYHLIVFRRRFRQTCGNDRYVASPMRCRAHQGAKMGLASDHTPS